MNVTDMSYMFYECLLLKSLPDISKWNTINLTFINNMFNKCSSLKYLPDLSKWSTSNIIYMDDVFFKYSESLPDISKWNINKVNDIRDIFDENSSLNKYPETIEEKKERETEQQFVEINNIFENLKSICKIKFNNYIGNGFFIKFYKDGKALNCLMSNSYIITKKMIESKEIIEVYYKYKRKMIKIKLDEKIRFIYYNSEMDITAVEIILEDKIGEKYFLLPYLNNLDIEYINRDIYFIQESESGKLNYSEGKIIDINNYKITYDASANTGLSGIPIFMKNSNKVIGMHKGSNKNENYGILIYLFMQLLDNKIKKKTKKFYENGEYYIGEMLNDLSHGKGILYDKDGSIIYEDDFDNDKYEGEGKLFYEN